MKSIKTYLLPLILITFFSSSVFSQSNTDTNSVEETKFSKIDSVLANGYMTEKEYDKKHKIKKHQKRANSDFYYGDEKTKEKDGEEKDSVVNEIAVEVIVEVVINTLFIIAAIWH